MISGIINIRKEKGFTSHDVVAKLRGILRQKKIGHTGTLDPDAEGVLPVCLGKATRLCDRIGDWDKTYEAVLLLGKTTDTEDISGTVLTERPVTVSEEEVREIILSFVGGYDQIPPMYSAKKVGGRKLYELAREGVVIERKACPVRLYDIVIREIALPYVTFSVRCSKGTYIRSLCRDIGEKAGCGGCMAALTRTNVAFFAIEDALTLAEVEALRDADAILEHILPVDSVFAGYPAVTVTEKAEKRLYNGNPVPWEACRSRSDEENVPAKPGADNPKSAGAGTDGAKAEESGAAMYRVYDRQGHFIGIYKRKNGAALLHPDKLFFDM